MPLPRRLTWACAAFAASLCFAQETSEQILRRHKDHQALTVPLITAFGSSGHVYITLQLTGQNGASAAGAVASYRRDIAEPNNPFAQNRLLFVSLETDPALLGGLEPLARVGDYGIFGQPDYAARTRQLLVEKLGPALDHIEQNLGGFFPSEAPFRRPTFGDASEVRLRSRLLPAAAASGGATVLTAQQHAQLVFGQSAGTDGFVDLRSTLHPFAAPSFSISLTFQDKPDPSTSDGRSANYESALTRAAESNRDRQFGNSVRSVPLLYLDAHLARRFAPNLKPVAHVANYGLLAPADFPDELLGELRAVVQLGLRSESFAKLARTVGVNPAIGDADAWPGVVASAPPPPPPTPARPPPPAAAPATTAGNSPAPGPRVSPAPAPAAPPTVPLGRALQPTTAEERPRIPILAIEKRVPPEKKTEDAAAFKRRLAEREQRLKEQRARAAKQNAQSIVIDRHVVGEYLRRDRETREQAVRDWQARLRAAERDRHAITVRVVNEGDRYFLEFTNRADANLYTVCDYDLFRNGEEQAVIWATIIVPARGGIRFPLNTGGHPPPSRWDVKIIRTWWHAREIDNPLPRTRP